ncbi:MAG: acyltransferase [Pseudomonadota bacterium]|jgi:1-acyl-sn-glycerol-3-phosphate acyltransferase|uniref:Acyltransferase n=1 Tax=Vreelandella aquamarina TaxID=77097 RepID=A0A6F8X8A4_9GAMM|nr:MULTISPECIES: acyltransferase [Halomonas]MEC8936902.1 acyltransferase [Pseudomonadota bacterium]MAD21835.1 acyltransferase [Halomonas sp.]MBV65519.1 acyltransferase [Halomonas sp.]MCC4287586.1 acyltransferase [Halomonas meridiana]MCC4290773.1 acyltransferase [Halomonas axialensis]|tara:strand:- start:1277 stop:2158 length:882 start_codon:yes stop_codon:yes gene_type:complete
MPIIKGGVSILLLTLNTLVWGVPLIILTLLKVIVPGRRQKEWLLKGLCAVALNWIGVNLWWMRHWLKPNVSINVPDTLSPEQWWLVISNHRSWTDIFILLMALHRRIPMPRFFLKHQLIWIPIVGLAFWALEFPFMRRFSREQIANNPKLATVDRESTERMCRQARHAPIAIFNFVEGTRFTVAKRESQQSPFQHLLRPKAGGIAQVLSLLGDQLDGILDVTISYTNPSPTFMGFLCGKEAPITLEARQLAIPEWMQTANYHDEPQHKERFHAWINSLWQEKDTLLDRLSDHD